MDLPTIPPEFDVDKNSIELDAEYTIEAIERWRLKDKKQLERLAKLPPLELSNPKITNRMLNILIDWLYSVRKSMKMCMQTWFLTSNYINEHILNSRGTEKDKLQLIGTTSFFVASKLEEIYCPIASDLSYITNHTYSEKQITEFEQEILATTQWNLYQVSIWSFVGRVCQLAEKFISTEKFEELRQLLMYYICIPNFQMSLYQKYLSFDLTLACYWLAAFTLDLPTWHEYFTIHFRKNERELKDVVLDLFPIFERIRNFERIDFHQIALQHKLPKKPTKENFE